MIEATLLKDHLKLHFIVLIWGFTGVLGALIQVPAIDVVFWRTLVATLTLLVVLSVNKTSLRVDRKTALQMLGTGFIVGAHWMTFFAGVKIGGASMGMVGLSTSTLWVALLAPLFIGRRISWLEFGLGLIVIVALGFIAQADYHRVSGLLLSILAAFLAAIFSYLNGRLTKRVHHNVIALYEIFGAFVVTGLAIPIFSSEGLHLPTWEDWCLIGVLATVCTVYAYATSVELLKRMSVFVVNLSVNLEPVYGMILAAFLLGEHHLLSKQFYGGSAVLIIGVLLYPTINRLRQRSQPKT